LKLRIKVRRCTSSKKLCYNSFWKR